MTADPLTSVNDDCRIYEAGEVIPDGWVSFKPNGLGPYQEGVIFFGVPTEVTFKDGWLRLHALEPCVPGKTIMHMDKWSGTEFHFNHDMAFFNEGGDPITCIIAAPGACFRLRNSLR